MYCLIFVILLFINGSVVAGVSLQGPINFDKAKKLLAADMSKQPELTRKTWYCGCEMESHIVLNCHTGVNPKPSESLEWDHVVPAAVFPKPPSCLTALSGGRKCARSRSRAFRLAEGDLINLVPAEASVNQIKSSKLPDTLEHKFTSKCGFEVGPNSFNPPPDKRGDVARIWFHMNQKHFNGRLIGPHLGPILYLWNHLDPISEEEKFRAMRLARLGSRHLFVPIKQIASL